MPRAIQHDTILNLPGLDLVLYPGEAAPVTLEQATQLEALGVTILPDSPAKPPLPPAPNSTPPAPALDEEHV